MSKRLLIALCMASVLGQPAMVHAQTSNAAIAEALYDEALKLMSTGKYAEACPKLEESNRLDPAMGTRFQLGDCNENLGKLATAWALFIEVGNEAERKGERQRKLVARERAARIQSRVPKLTIVLAPEVAALPGIRVRHNGAVVNQPLWSTPLPVDPGEHLIEVTATGRENWKKVVELKESAAETLTIDALAVGDSTAQGSFGLRNAAIMLGVVGGAGLLAGSISGGLTFTRYQEAEAECKIKQCDARDDEEFNRRSNIANVSFIVGGVAAATAITLAILSRPKSAEKQQSSQVWVMPVANTNTAQLFVMGRF